MATVDALLSTPINWHDYVGNADLRILLSDLQANILKGHGRDHSGNIFLSFGTMKAGAIASLLQKLSTSVTSALAQLRSADAYKNSGINGGRVICLFLSAEGYRKLGLASAPGDAAFKAGMRARGQAATVQFENLPPIPGLNDPPVAQWGEGPWSPANPAPDAMILVADDSTDSVTDGLEAMETLVGGSGAKVLGVDRGEAQRRVQAGGNPKGEGLEHFGYVDGRSQPLFLQEDIAGEPALHWDPAFPPSQFIVTDPHGHSGFACGSYFVYRKLEQNVKAFKENEDQLAAALNLTGAAAERAGALAVGRFEDGTPVVLHCDAQAGAPGNDFNYDVDPDGLKCPFRAHVRKTNPRGESDAKLGAVGPRGERTRIMARRGITYGQRKPRPEGADFPEHDRPENQVGLLFMAYMADIAEQFEFTQAAWAGNADFVTGGTGIDPVIGQRANSAPSHIAWHDQCSGHSGDLGFKTHIKLLGGEYFFAPSLSFLTNPLG